MQKNQPVRLSINFRNKIAAIFFGFCLFFILLEIGLRLAGFIVLFLQENRNRQSLKHKSSYRIMCLGESTTQGQYPRYLEEVLNKRGTGVKFSVIDKGIAAVRCNYIVSNLENNLNLYKPDMVIVMMGINNGATHMFFKPAFSSKPSLLEELKVYKLAQYIFLHGATKINAIKTSGVKEMNNDSRSNNNVIAPIEPDVRNSSAISYESEIKSLNKEPLNQAVDDKSYVSLGQIYQESAGEYELALQVYEKALAINPRNYDAHLGLGYLYMGKADFEKAIAECKKAIEINPDVSLAYICLGEAYLILPPSVFNSSPVREIFQKALELNNPQSVYAYKGLAEYYRRTKDFLKSKETLLRALTVFPQNGSLYMHLIGLCNEFNREDLAKQYLEEYNKFPLKPDNLVVSECYRRLRRIISQKGITLACMQYPTLHIEPLKEYFGRDNEGIIFIENRENFLAALRWAKPRDYFTDMFGGTFGHCTERGNRLIAENIANVIVKELVKNNGTNLSNFTYDKQ